VLRCEHCKLPIYENEAIWGDYGRERLTFCCHGCKGVYEIIHKEGLESFYEQRKWDDSNYPLGKALFRSVQANQFEELVKVEKDSIKSINFYIDNIRCASCVWLNEKILTKTRGIKSARINYATYNAHIIWDDSEISLQDILNKIVSIGYCPKPFKETESFKLQKAEAKDLLIRFGTACFLSSQLMVYSIALYAGYFQDIDVNTKFALEIIALFLTTPIVFYSGLPFLKNTLKSLRHLHFNMDTLISTGAMSAYVFSIYQLFIGGKVYFDVASMIITLILLGRYIETTAKSRASEEIYRLYELLPTEARIDGQEDRFIPIKSLTKGQKIRIIPGERIPIDAIVINGETETDESLINGESKPVFKTVGSIVIGGSINLNGSIVGEVINDFENTFLSGIVNSIMEAQTRKPHIQNIADKVVAYFVPIIFILAFMTGLYHFFNAHTLAYSLMVGISVIVIACPCSLGLATPLAILIATTKATKIGILIKGADIIEKVRMVNTVVFDKTGTLTVGKPKIKEIIIHKVGYDKESVLLLSASLERHSEHSIAKAIIEAARGMSLHTFETVETKPGRGIKGIYEGVHVLIGNRLFMSENQISLTDISSDIYNYEKEGNTLVYVSKGGELIATIVISDKIRDEAFDVIRDLDKGGFQIYILSGDNSATTLSVASRLCVKNVYAEMLPNQKQEFIRDRQSKVATIMMIGDGINDAPSLKESFVGLSMAKGTDVAMESADIVLTREDLRLIPILINLSCKTYNIIRQNIFLAFIYNIVAVPVAMVGLLHPIISAIAMALSSLCVVTNSLRIRN